MELGEFSISLQSRISRLRRLFYEKLGFKELHGDISQNWLIMKNGDNVIGLFQGMFEKNILTSTLAGTVTPRSWIPLSTCAKSSVA